MTHSWLLFISIVDWSFFLTCRLIVLTMLNDLANKNNDRWTYSWKKEHPQYASHTGNKNQAIPCSLYLQLLGSELVKLSRPKKIHNQKDVNGDINSTIEKNMQNMIRTTDLLIHQQAYTTNWARLPPVDWSFILKIVWVIFHKIVKLAIKWCPIKALKSFKIITGVAYLYQLLGACTPKSRSKYI